MTTAYIYSPTNGIITGRTNYCMTSGGCDNDPCEGDHGTHGTCKGWYSPVDIDAGNDEGILLKTNWAIRSVRFYVQNECCCNDNNDYGRVVIAELYHEYNALCYVGAALYGHIKNPQVQNNQVQNFSNGANLIIGYSPSGSFSCNGFTCYSGSHVHMERIGGRTIAPCCCGGTSKGSTAIYRWDFTNCPQ